MDSSISPSRVAPPRPPKSEQPLLPPLLLGPPAFFWFWVLPVGVLLFLNLQGFRLIEGNMDANQRNLAVGLGLGNLANVLIGAALFVLLRRWAKRRSAAATPHYGLALSAIVVQVAYLWSAMALMDDVLPSSVTSWLYPQEHFMFNQFAFAMLPLFLGILRLSAFQTLAGFGRSVAVNLALAIAGPVFLFVAFQSFRLFGLWPRMAGVSFVTLVVVLSIVMFVGLSRALLILLRQTRDWGATGERAAIVGFALVLPIAGLLLNRSIPFPVDLQAWEVYALVVANTGVLLLASYQHARRPLLTFSLLCGTLPFSLYFFIVFLPYTPLSILAVIAMGVGFLVLTPILLFVLHLHLLKEAWLSPLLTENRRGILIGGFACFLLLPAFFTARGLADKAALNAALDYVYTPTIKTGATIYPASRLNLARALRNHRSYKNGLFYPLLSGFYSWLVFDNLVLPDDKLAQLELVFFGKVGAPENHDPFRNRTVGWRGNSVRDRSRMPRATLPPRTVEVSRLEHRITSAGEQASTVTLSLTLKNIGQSPAEYVKTLPLPDGIFVSGFRLQVNGAFVPGRLVEKKTALWVYSMIRDSERRDPGLLYYNHAGELELRVFPVAPALPSRVEIDLLVPTTVDRLVLADSNDPAELLATLGARLSPQRTANDKAVILAGGLDRLSLPSAERETSLHLIVDRSEGNGYDGRFTDALRQLKARFPTVQKVRITLANYNVIDYVDPLTAWDKLPRCSPDDFDRALPSAGGFAIDLALAHALRQHAACELDYGPHDTPPPRPIYVILSRKATVRTLDLSTTEAWSDMVASVEIQELDTSGRLIVQRATDSNAVRTAHSPLLKLGDSVRPLLPNHPVRFPKTSEREIIRYWDPSSSRWQPLSSAAEQAPGCPWAEAAGLFNRAQDQARTPGASENTLKGLVKASRDLGILLPVTSYIVLENTAQWRMLDLSERKKLEQNAALGFRETDAPPFLYLGLGFGLWLGLRRLSRRTRSSPPYPTGKGAYS